MLSDLGVSTGSFTLTGSDGTVHDIAVEDGDTLGDLISAINSTGAAATLDSEGVLRIYNANITDQGDTNISSALGLSTTSTNVVQASGDLSPLLERIDTVTASSTATLDTKLEDLNTYEGSDWLRGMYSDTQIIAKDGSYSINVNITSNAESTIGDVFEELSDYGITGSIDSSGKVVLSGDNIVSGDVIESLLGLDTTEITCIQSSSSMQSPTVTTYAELTEDTLLTKVKIAGDAVTIVVASSYSYTTSTVTAGQTAILYDKNKNAYGTFTVSSTSTISDLLNAINNNTLGVSATLTDSQIVIEHGSIGGQLGTLFNGVSSNVYYAKPITTTLSIAKNAGIAAGETVGTVSVTRTATSGLTALSSVDSSTSISSGTYKISTTADLAQLATMTNNGLITGGTYILANDIDLSSCENWTPIGTRAHAFTGTFDGNGYTISNMTVSITSDSTDSYIDAGLFGCVEYGTIKNIGLTSATVNVSSQDRKTKQFIGGLIGLAVHSEVLNSYADVNISIGGSIDSVAGGLIGSSTWNTSILNCYTSGKIVSNSEIADVGGLVGTAMGITTVNGCYSSIDITSPSQSEYNLTAGGLIGEINGQSYISNSYTSGNIENFSKDAVSGGIVGETYSGSYITISNCYTNGNVRSFSETGDVYAGGLIGYIMESSGINISNSYTSGDIYGTDYSGGLVGYITLGSSDTNDFTISNCYTSGNITANPDGGCTGGILGGISSHYTTVNISSVSVMSTSDLDGVGVGYYVNTLVNVSNIEYISDSPIVNTRNINLSTTSVTKTDSTVIPSGMGTYSITRTDTSELTSLSSVDSSTWIGNGTYKISTTDELAQLATMTNNNKIGGGTYILANDIDLSSCENWTPIGTNANAFQGTFDGNGYTISNMTISISSDSTSSTCVGLFGRTLNANIKNVQITNATVTGESISYVAGLVGSATNTNIDNCAFSGTVSNTGFATAGLVAWGNYLTISHSSTSGTVLSSGNHISGLVGLTYSDISIDSSYTNSEITSSLGAPTAGFLSYVYYANDISITNSAVLSDVGYAFVAACSYYTNPDELNISISNSQYKSGFTSPYSNNTVRIYNTYKKYDYQNTTLEDMGINSNQYVYITNQATGTKTTITISPTSTIFELNNDPVFSQYFTVTQDDKFNLSITPTSDTSGVYISGISDSLRNKAFLSSDYKITHSQTLALNSDDEIVSGGSIYSSDTKIWDMSNTELKNVYLGLKNIENFDTSGYDATYSNNTLSIGKTMTIEEFCEMMNKNGIFAGYNESTGLLSIDESYVNTENGGSSWTGGSDIAFLTNLFNLNSLRPRYDEKFDSDGLSELTTSTSTVIQDLTSATLSSLGINTVQIKNTDGDVLETVNLNTYSTVGKLQNYLSNKYGISLYATTDSTGSYLESYGNDSIYADFGNTLSTSVSKNYQSSKLEIANPVSTIPVSESTLLSEFDNGILTSQGALVVRKESGDVTLNISKTETLGSFMEKLNSAGINTTLNDGYLTLGSMDDYELVSLTSNAPATLGLIRSSEEYGLQSNSEVLTNISTVAEQTISVSNYADLSSKLSDLNISSGTLSIFRNGSKSIIHIDDSNTLNDLNSQISSAFSDVRLTLEDGKVVISSTSGAKVEVGVNTDTSNFASIVGISSNENNAEGTVALYKVNGNSVLTNSGLFRTGTVNAGTFTIGNATFTIDNTTTMDSIISQINSSEDSYANAYWDSINGQLVLTSTVTGASLMNIEAGTSNFTDILGLTTSTWNTDGTVQETALNMDAQTLGSNAKFSINGTNFVSSSNTVTSDISRISGLTLNLKGISEDGGSTTITVENDSQSVADALSDIVDGYNTLMENLDKELSSTGNLSKETTLKAIKQQIRSLMLSSVSGLSTYKTLDSIGISVSAASASNISTTTASITDLTIDKDKFMEAYEDDSSEIKALLVGTTDNEGILTKIETIVENALQASTGYFDIASKAYDTKISTIDNKITKQNKIVEAYKTRLENKFNLMDQLISNMQNQYSSFLSS